MTRSPVLGAAFGAFAVWWSASLLLYLATGRVFDDESWMALSGHALFALMLGAVLGTIMMVGYVVAARQWRVATLRGDNVRGVTCSIGPLPINFEPPKQTEDMPQKSSLRMPAKKYDPQGLVDIDWMDKWFAKYEGPYPDHAALMRAVAKVLNTKPKLPAACKKMTRRGKKLDHHVYGYDQHAHGGHTLLEHSWVAASVGIAMTSREGWKYTGMHFAREGEKTPGKGAWLPRNDEKYEFKSFDPMIGLLCFAHDIGKIETFNVDAEGKTYQVNIQHDTVGAQMLTRMEEFWNLEHEDQLALLMTVGHYHKPAQMPLRRDRKVPNGAVAINDRMMALLQLIIEADNLAGRIENREDYEQGKDKPKEIVEEEYNEDLWQAFKALINESRRVWPDPDKYRIGQKNTLSQGTLIVLKEDVLRKALLDALELRGSVKSEVGATGASKITVDLLKVLDAKGCLAKEFSGVEVKAEEAIWKVEFMGKDKNKPGEVISTWPFSIIFRPESVFPKLCELPDANSLPRVVGVSNFDRINEPRKARPKLLDALEQPAMEDKDGIPIIPEGEKSKARAAKKTAATTPGPKPQVQQVVGKPAPAPTPASMPVAGSAPNQDAGPAAGPVRQPAPSPEADPAEEDGAHAAEVDETSKAIDNAEMSFGADFLEEVDPVPPGHVSAVQEQDEHSADRESEVTSKSTPGIDSSPAAPAVEVAPGQTAGGDQLRAMLRQKLQEAALGGQHAGQPAPETPSEPEAPHGPAQRETEQEQSVSQGVSEASSARGTEPDLPEWMQQLVVSLARPLNLLQSATAQRKIAPEEWEGGRLAYSLDAIQAVDPSYDHWATDDVRESLIKATRLGPGVPVCMQAHPVEKGVLVIVVNRRAVKAALLRTRR